MAIRKGAEAIKKRNEVAAKSQGPLIPELVLTEDLDTALFRMLTEDPIDVDMHDISEEISGRPRFVYCPRDDGISCEYCENRVPRHRIFMIWAYVYKILHNQQNKDRTWAAEKLGKRDVYAEVIEDVRLIKRKFGKGGAMYAQFEDKLENYGTYTDRDYALKRTGVRYSKDTTYTLTPLDASPLSPKLMGIQANLPELELVAKGIVTTLKPPQKDGPLKKPATVSREVDLPDEDGLD